MPKIPRDILDDIHERLDAIELISQYLTLDKNGKDYKGLCPFHEEKSPSFMVSAEKKVFHCFGCGEGGNLYTFIMKMEGLNFRETVQNLAARVGVDLSNYQQQSQDGEDKEIYYRINNYAAWFFKDALAKAPQGLAARLLEDRGLHSQTIQNFHLGFAPDSWQGLVDFLKSKKVPLEKAEALGLIRRKDDGRHYDFFRNRLMFPIHDFEGRVIGFGGRRLDDADKKQAKYVNSPESPIYHKGSSIYGLYQAKKAIRDHKSVVLVEGYTDVMRLAQEGIAHATAPLGTALGQDQITVLKRYADEFVLLFDGDEAGRKAQQRAIVLLLEAGLHPKVVYLPEGSDPDSYLQENAADVLQTQIQDALPAVEWMISKGLVKVGSQTDKRIAAVKRLMPYIARLDKLEQKTYKARLTQFLGLSESDLNDLTPAQSSGAKVSAPAQQKTKISLERILLELYVSYPQKLNEQLGENFFAYFKDDQLKQLGTRLYDEFSQNGQLNVSQWLHTSDEAYAKVLSEIAFSDQNTLSAERVTQMIGDCVARFKEQRLKEELKELTSQIHLAETNHDRDGLKNLLVRKNEAMKTLKNLHYDMGHPST